jgi:hypothetical protein
MLNRCQHWILYYSMCIYIYRYYIIYIYVGVCYV